MYKTKDVREYLAHLPPYSGGFWSSGGFAASPEEDFIRFLAKTGNWAAQKNFSTQVIWDNNGVGDAVRAKFACWNNMHSE